MLFCNYFPHMSKHVIGQSILWSTIACSILLFCCRFRKQYEKYDVIYKHYPGPCKQLLGPGIVSDFQALPWAVLTVTSVTYCIYLLA